MNAEFSTKKVGDKDVEFVTLSGGFLGKDTVTREASAADLAEFKAEYEAFKNPPPPPEDKDAKIAALDAELAKASTGTGGTGSAPGKGA